MMQYFFTIKNVNASQFLHGHWHNLIGLAITCNLTLSRHTYTLVLTSLKFSLLSAICSRSFNNFIRLIVLDNWLVIKFFIYFYVQNMYVKALITVSQGYSWKNFVFLFVSLVKMCTNLLGLERKTEIIVGGQRFIEIVAMKLNEARTRVSVWDLCKMPFHFHFFVLTSVALYFWGSRSNASFNVSVGVFTLLTSFAIFKIATFWS